jgi:hypothetical protein
VRIGARSGEKKNEGSREDQDWSNYSRDARVLQDDGAKAITRTYVNGVQPVYHVKMSHGLIVESTGNHPWWVKGKHGAARRVNSGTERFLPTGEWIKTKNLSKGDVLEVALGIYNVTAHAPLRNLLTVAFRMRGDADVIKQPSHMNEDLAWLLGYLWGDGSLSPAKFRIRFIDQNKPHVEKAARILRQQFGLNGTVHRAGQNRNAWVLEVGSKHLWFWLLKNGVFKYDADKIDLIPPVVRFSSRDDIIAFIAGLIDADGTVSIQRERKRQLVVASADERFSRHLQDVAWAVGLGFGMSHNTVGQNLQMRKSMYLMSLSGYATEDAFTVLSEYSEKIKTSDQSLPFTHQLASPNRSVVGKVASVEIIGEMSTYDIGVADNQWFYAGAVKSRSTPSV